MNKLDKDSALLELINQGEGSSTSKDAVENLSHSHTYCEKKEQSYRSHLLFWGWRVTSCIRGGLLRKDICAVPWNVRNHPLCAAREQGSRMGNSMRPETTGLLEHEGTGAASWGNSTVRGAQKGLR